MDGDPAVEPELDGFSLILPLPYRVALITSLAAWGWGANLHYLHRQKIDVPALLRYPGRASPAHDAPHHHSAYRLAAAASSLLAASLLLFWALTRRDPDRVLAYDWLPMTMLAALGVLLILPFPLPGLRRRLPLPQDGRRRFAATLRRVAVGGLAEASHGKFGDILLADVLTSCSKMLADLYVCVCMFFFTSRAGREASATDRPDRNCGGGVVVPLIMAMPFLARFRQCLIEYLRVRRSSGGDPAAGRQHLANAAKYATSFPVILFSALLRRAQAQEDAAAQTAAAAPASTTYYRLWLAAAVVNSLYSFYWDVAKDWDLTLLDGARARSAPDNRAWGLRRRLYLEHGQPLVYYAAVALDLVLRCTPWALKLSPRLDHVADFESALFLVQLLEVFRRWVWLFFRIETEWIRTVHGSGAGSPAGGISLGGGGLLGGSRSASASSSSSSAGANPTDILLGDYQAKYDDDDDDDE